MDVEFYFLIGLIIALCLNFWIFRKTPEDKEYERKLKESLNDEFITDPETGVKLTLEEAESGVWLAHDNEFRTIPEEELNKIANDNEREVEVALNYIRESRFFIKTDLTYEEENKLKKTKVLKGYDNWFYSDAYKFENGFIFLPSVEWNKNRFHQEVHLMIWYKIETIEGHYLFREKTSSEKFFDRIRNDDDIKLKNYECFTVEKSRNIIKINTILNKIIHNKGLEIEIDNDNLFIKTLKLVDLEDVKKMERIILNLS
ncbi:hypothetical protein [Pontimicrobium sp. MEBiC01747]